MSKRNWRTRVAESTRTYYSWQAFRAGLFALIFGLLIGAIKPAAPATAFFTAIVTICTAYWAKRIVAKKLNPTDAGEAGDKDGD